MDVRVCVDESWGGGVVGSPQIFLTHCQTCCFLFTIGCSADSLDMMKTGDALAVFCSTGLCIGLPQYEGQM